MGCVTLVTTQKVQTTTEAKRSGDPDPAGAAGFPKPRGGSAAARTEGSGEAVQERSCTMRRYNQTKKTVCL